LFDNGGNLFQICRKLFFRVSAVKTNGSEIADSVNAPKGFESVIKETLKNGCKVMCEPSFRDMT
jgi:hypothetical protein